MKNITRHYKTDYSVLISENTKSEYSANQFSALSMCCSCHMCSSLKSI